MVTITDKDIAALRTEAGQAGDMAMVLTCTHALGWYGSDDEAKSDRVRAEARAECEQVIRDAAASC